MDKDTKHRQLFYVFHVGGKDEQIITLTDETDAKWIGGLSRLVEPNPKDNSQILFASEKDGYNHLYLATLERRKADANATGETRQENPSDAGFSSVVNIKQLTGGNYEVEWAKWRKDKDQIVYSSSENDTAARNFYLFDLKNGSKYKMPSSEIGMRNSPQLSDSGDSEYLLYNFSRWNAPTELYAQKICPECSAINMPKKLTASIPDAFKQMKWSEPQFVSIQGERRQSNSRENLSAERI